MWFPNAVRPELELRPACVRGKSILDTLQPPSHSFSASTVHRLESARTWPRSQPEFRSPLPASVCDPLMLGHYSLTLLLRGSSTTATPAAAPPGAFHEWPCSQFPSGPPPAQFPACLVYSRADWHSSRPNSGVQAPSAWRLCPRAPHFRHARCPGNC